VLLHNLRILSLPFEVTPADARSRAEENSFSTATAPSRVPGAIDRCEGHVEALLSLANEAILLTSASGTIQSANASASRLLGYTSDALVGLSCLELFDPLDERLRAARAKRTRGQPLAGEFRIRRADGSAVETEVSGVSFRDADDRLLTYYQLRDLTEARHTESTLRTLRARDTSANDEARPTSDEQLQHGQRLQSLGVIAGGIAHDFNNLLVGILGNTSLALADVAQDAELCEVLRDVEAAALRAADLTRRILGYAAPGTGASEPIDISATVREVAQLLHAAVSKHATLTLDLAPSLPMVRCDATRVVQLLMNLLTNASDAVEGVDGAITLSTRVITADAEALRSRYVDNTPVAGTYVMIEVRDNGVGMSEETQRRIFDPFFTTKSSGRGLGLASTLEMIRSSGGAIQVESAPGAGTTFRVYLPKAAEVAEQAPAPISVAPEPRGNGIALVVDDDSRVGVVARQMLERRGYEVVIADDGAEALELMHQAEGAITLALVDLHMPRMGGEELAIALRALDERLQVVIMSGSGSEEFASRFPASLVSACVRKPFTLAELDAALIRVAQVASSAELAPA